ncbi:MAG: hypothetical protein ACLQLC_16120 [Candidatus Sulfotelmatobacter sp.]
MHRLQVLCVFVVTAIVGLTSCGGAASLPPITGTTPPISVLFLIAPPSSLAINATTTVNAAATNDSNGSFTWSATCGSGACGSFGSMGTPSGINNTYTAPSSIPSGTTVTITATLVGDSSKSISASITITPPLPIAVAFSRAPLAVLQINATASLAATITNDVSPNPQVKWTVTCASTLCGSFNPTTTTSEVPSTFTAPSAIPSGNTVTVTATSMTDPTKSASDTITIIPTAATLANGTYVFQVSGAATPQANFVSGVIVAQSGSITSGEQDFVNYEVDGNSNGGNLFFFDPITGGSYATTADGNLQITINTSDLNVGINGVETFNGVIVSASRVLIAEVNGFSGAGSLDLQTSRVAPSAGYAFSTFGVDEFGLSAGIGGILNIDSPGGISGGGSELDMTDNFTVSGKQSLAPSTVSAPDSFGRVVFQLLPGQNSAILSLNLAGYIVDGNRIRLVETAGDNFQGVMGGTALSQGSNTGGFTANSISGSSYVFGAAGVDINGSLQIAGVFTANADGSLTGTLNWNDLTGTGVQSPVAFTGSYTVDAAGQVTLNNLSDTSFNYQLELFLNGSGEALLLSSDTGEMMTGRAIQQQSGSFSAASLNGTYGSNASQVAMNFGELGPAAALGPVSAAPGTGTDTLTGFVDFGSGATDFPVSGSLTVSSNGILTGTLNGLDASSSGTADNFTLYLIDDTRSVIIETDTTQLTLGYLELQQ